MRYDAQRLNQLDGLRGIADCGVPAIAGVVVCIAVVGWVSGKTLWSIFGTIVFAGIALQLSYFMWALCGLQMWSRKLLGTGRFPTRVISRVGG